MEEPGRFDVHWRIERSWRCALLSVDPLVYARLARKSVISIHRGADDQRQTRRPNSERTQPEQHTQAKRSKNSHNVDSGIFLATTSERRVVFRHHAVVTTISGGENKYRMRGTAPSLAHPRERKHLTAGVPTVLDQIRGVAIGESARNAQRQGDGEYDGRDPDRFAIW